MERGDSKGFQGCPRASKLPTSSSEGTKVAADINNGCIVREQDRLMPVANVIRIMRKILPPNAKISDDAKETIQECVSEYISFITGEANDRCHLEQRKTVTAEDVLWAMSRLGFDDYIEPLTHYLNRYRYLEGKPLVNRHAGHDPNTMGDSSNGLSSSGAFYYHHGGDAYYDPQMVGYVKEAPKADSSSSSSSQAQADIEHNVLFGQGKKL